MDPLVSEFYRHYPHLQYNKAVESFISQTENRKLVEDFLRHPSASKEERLNEAFKAYYFDIRFTSYVSSSLYFHSVNFDKKIRKYSERHPLTLDDRVGEDGGSYVELVPDPASEIAPFTNYSTLMECLESEELLKAYKTLTDKQKHVLDLAYVQERSDTEIARMQGVSQQTISKTHRKALHKLKSILEKGES
ncbi:sigma-70 family RNA polymerase sigma factor [Rossellomorea vietnamensis]|uniref:Sigma-70 family RNA polymerase sigma factor n=1 Tax=Rossellomorea vietnamensis TaxID=218284 RepID=A0ACD4C3Q7_9BACI|nr:sigma-70 family RNA polymerase sigma factor [Rossellomorea vietnamensis]UXH43051.1 sigma-70 family RNA polymerase sigma factor [Rossellomorea vietnamensis]